MKIELTSLENWELKPPFLRDASCICMRVV